MEVMLFACIVFLAYANGANDNSKGVATLFGSGVTQYRGAILWGTLATLLGSLMAVFIAKGLLGTFSGKGLVPNAVALMPSFTVAVALAAALTVMLAVRLGMPISTTHALVGALVGAGWFASRAGVDTGQLWHSFFMPLLVSPLLAIAAAALVYPVVRYVRRALGITRQTCVCIGQEIVASVPEGTVDARAAVMAQAQSLPIVRVGVKPACMDRYTGRVVGVECDRAVHVMHYLSAGAVSFARGVNDTPKMAAILLLTGGLSAQAGITLVGIVIAIGGWLSARRVAETMGHRITGMNPGQGLVANLVTSTLVLGASALGMPVSTTHVSCGALFGIGTVTGQGRWGTIGAITLSWVVTLPVAALLGAAGFAALRGLGG